MLECVLISTIIIVTNKKKTFFSNLQFGLTKSELTSRCHNNFDWVSLRRTYRTIQRCVRSIAWIKDGQIVEPYYEFPEHLQLESNHPELFKIKTVKTACEQMTKKCNLTVTLPDETAKLYRDEDLNFVYQSFYLEELEEKKDEKPPSALAGEGQSTKELQGPQMIA